MAMSQFGKSENLKNIIYIKKKLFLGKIISTLIKNANMLFITHNNQPKVINLNENIHGSATSMKF